MEESLDDAINVLRNHCGPQLGLPLSGLDGNTFVGTSPVGGEQLQNDNQTNESTQPIKSERVVVANSSNESTFWMMMRNEYLINGVCFIFVLEKRKEPPDSDTKPSSSVEGSAKGSAKRARR